MPGMKGRSNPQNRFQGEQERSRATSEQDVNRSLKRVFGIIHEVDPNGTGSSIVTAWVNKPDGSRRLWGGNENTGEIVISEAPTDILSRFVGLKPGMVIEITWRGIDETGKAYAKVVTESGTVEAIRNGAKIPSRDVDTQSSLPFEPFGFFG